ncbi:ParA family protein [Roseobacter denitrificans]|uniref:RC102 n=1 Tax=Roseobacter denitrificans (strain ATCC 33942 / OCh 114) TaxID=375451 RepID=Q07GS5_ROSDO|nr:AAA family ATPase [Roseobacter denitrificans]ABI93324.1 RC102 [Roseobacter denitrificans OCh 114]SFG40737.1 chromosome partitioning protein [Roseobacter denitrificans OCh 114]
MSGNLEQFLTDLSRGLDRTMVSVNKELTLRTRIQRKWSMRQCARFLNVGITYLNKFAKSTADFPQGEYVGRERVFTIEELMHMRALFAETAKRPYDYLAWRKPEDPLPVISFASQKGGTAKSLTAAHFAQYLSLNYGMRVGVMDADPQSTITLYFVGGEGLPAMPTEDTASMVDFAGLFPNGDKSYTDYDAEELDSFFLRTSWPGLRLVPAHGETSEGEIQIARLVSERPKGKNFYRFLRDSIERWRDGHVPQTEPNELASDGVLDREKFDAALNETLDCIVIDYQPALTLFQLNNVVASSSLVIPQTMKGFDIATLSTFVNGLLGMLQHILRNERIDIGSGANMLLPTIVQRTNNQDLDQISNLLEHCPAEILPVFYLRSDSISNASDVYQSVYEYQADTPGKRKGIERFITNADAVNDAIVSRLWPGRERGYADKWMDDFYQDDEEVGK